MSEIETLKSMEINEKMHGVKMNLGEFLKQVLEGGFFSYSGSLTTPGLLMINKFKNIIFLISFSMATFNNFYYSFLRMQRMRELAGIQKAN